MIPNPYSNIRAEFEAKRSGVLFTRAVIGWDDDGRALVSGHRGRCVPAMEEDNFVCVLEKRPPAPPAPVAVPGLYV